jgi:ankyrin repeat protein
MATFVLHNATTAGNARKLKKLLTAGADVNARDSEGDTCLYLACRDGWLDVVKLLVEHGADVNLPIAYRGMLPLGVASQRKNGRGPFVRIVELLVKKRADVDRRDGEGWPPLLIAIQQQCVDVVRALLNAGASTDPAGWGFSFRERKFDINDGRHWTPLQMAIMHHNVDAVRLLLEHGATLHRMLNGKDELDLACTTGI